MLARACRFDSDLRHQIRIRMLINILGWIGTALVVAAYFMVSSERIHPKTNVYNLMNLFGALFIGANVYSNHAWPALGLQIVWGGGSRL